MKNYLLLTFLIIIHSGISHASHKEKIDKNIEDLLVQLFIQLDKWAGDNLIDSPQEKMAYVLTMAAVVIPTTNNSPEPSSLFWDEAWETSWFLVENFAHLGTRDVVQEIINELFAKKSARIVTKKNADRDYYAEKKSALVYLVKNIENIMNIKFPNMLYALEETAENPFSNNNKEYLSKFYNKYFGTLKLDAIIVLAPWLASILPTSCIHEDHRALFLNFKIIQWKSVLIFLLLVNNSRYTIPQGGALLLLPSDLINYMTSYIIYNKNK